MIGGAPVGMIGNLQRPNGALGSLGSGVVGTPGAFPGVGGMQMNSKLPTKAGTKTVQGRMQPDAHSQVLGQGVGQVQGQHRGRMGDQHTDNSWADANNMAAQPGAAMRKLHGLDVSKLVDMEQVRFRARVCTMQRAQHLCVLIFFCVYILMINKLRCVRA
jgi:hypothetical protein